MALSCDSIGIVRRTARIAAAATVVIAVSLIAAPLQQQARAQSASGSLRVAIISPANGGGTAGQTLEAGAFAIVNDTSVAVSVSSVTIAFTDPSIFSSASLSQLGVESGFPSSVHYDNQFIAGTPPQVSASSIFYFSPALQIAPGGQPVFALMVKMAASISRNEIGNIAYAAMTSPTASRASATLWLAIAIIGLAMAGLPAGKRRRATLIAALVILLTLGAPGCGSDNSSASSTQSVTAVSAFSASQSTVHSPSSEKVLRATASGLPLRLGVVSWH